MLQELIAENRRALAARVAAMLPARTVPYPRESSPSVDAVVEAFAAALAADGAGHGGCGPLAAASAAHARHLRALGYSVAEVVSHFTAISRTAADLASERGGALDRADVTALHRALEVAIAAAVSEHERLTAEQAAKDEVRRLGEAAHELRDLTHTALLGLHQLSRDNGADSRYLALLGRSLVGLQYVVDSMVSGVRLTAGQQSAERMTVAQFLREVESTARLHAEYRGLRFMVECCDPAPAFDIDAPLLTSAVMNLLHNAFKHTPAGGCVVLRARFDAKSVAIEVQDQCGGMPKAITDLFHAFGERRGRDRRGLGLGLAMARDAARANHGEIRLRNLPGHGCVFVLEVPLAATAEAPAVDRAQLVPRRPA